MADEKSDKKNAEVPQKRSDSGRAMGFVLSEPCCPVCLELGHRESLKEVTGLIEIAPNPQAERGIARVVDCTAGCRFGLEPYFNPKSDGSYCYMLLRSDRNPGAVVNHYWFKPEWIERGP